MKKIAILKINHQDYKKGDILILNKDNFNCYEGKQRHIFSTIYVETKPDIFEIQEIPEYIIVTKSTEDTYWYKDKIYDIFEVINRINYHIDTYVTEGYHHIDINDCREATPAEVEAFKLGYKIGDIVWRKKDNNKLGTIEKILGFDQNNNILILVDEYYIELDRITNIEPKQLLIEEAKRRYPVGTRIKDIETNSVHTINTETFHTISCATLYNIKDTGNIGSQIYNNGIWAEIVKPVFTTIDGVNIYDEEYYYFISNNTIEKTCAASFIDSYKDTTKRFHNRIKAEKYLREHQVKRYKFYGEMLTKEEIFEKAKKLYTIGSIYRWYTKEIPVGMVENNLYIDEHSEYWYIRQNTNDYGLVVILGDKIEYATIYTPIE